MALPPEDLRAGRSERRSQAQRSGKSSASYGWASPLAAKAAAPKAKDIFLSALSHISLTDALGLVTSGSTDAATQFLRKSTEQQLVTAFKPDISTAIGQVGAEAAYTKMTTQYNRIPLMTPVKTDLAAYTTQKAVDGIFILMAQEEAKIRKNPAARTSDILKQVFGGR